MLSTSDLLFEMQMTNQPNFGPCRSSWRSRCDSDSALELNEEQGIQSKAKSLARKLMHASCKFRHRLHGFPLRRPGDWCGGCLLIDHRIPSSRDGRNSPCCHCASSRFPAALYENDRLKPVASRMTTEISFPDTKRRSALGHLKQPSSLIALSPIVRKRIPCSAQSQKQITA